MSRKISHTRRTLMSGAALSLLIPRSLLGNAADSKAAAGAAQNPEYQFGISLAEFGARGDGTDQTAALHAARDAIEAQGSDTLYIPRGDYRVAAVLNNRFVHLQGAGNAASILRNTSATGAIIRATHASGAWEGTRLSDIGFEGISRRQGSGFAAGNETLTRFIEYTGRFLFERVRFINLAKGIERPFGNVGFDLTDCVFADADFHIWSRGQPVASRDNHTMHPGCLTLRRGSMQGAQKASIYIDGRNVVGAGQVVLDSVRFEANPGWVLYIKDFNDRGPQPGILVRCCWNENNYTAGTVEIDGEVSPPGFAKLVNVPAITFEDTPVGPLVLANSHVITRGCNLDLLTSLVMDEGSSLIHHEARMYSGTARGQVSSIGQLENTDAAKTLNTPWFPMALPSGQRAKDRSVLVVSNAQVPERWHGAGTTSLNVDEVALPWAGRVQQLVIAGGSRLASPTPFVIPANSWLVLQFVARLVSGASPQVHINGTTGFGGVAHIRSVEAHTYTAVLQNSGPAIGAENFYIYSGGPGPAVLHFGGYAVTMFGNSQSALAFANSRLFPRE